MADTSTDTKAALQAKLDALRRKELKVRQAIATIKKRLESAE